MRSWLGQLERMEEDKLPKKSSTKTGRDETKRKTKERIERGCRKGKRCE
jgi:hypothetical protein